MNPMDSMSLRTDLERAADRAGGFPESRFAGRGMVVCAGGAKILTNAYVLVRLLRDQLGSTLPIEIWHIGPREMPPLIAAMFVELDCAVVDALSVMKFHPADIHDGWQLKAYALINSAFEEVIMLDADQVPLIDPATIFEWPEYRKTGAVFWPDIMDLSPKNPVWRRVDLEPRTIRSFETGQICINKKTHWKPLAVALRMNELADVFYDLIYGDKDTFLLAWLLCGADFSLVSHPPMTDMRFLGQRDFSGKVILQHRTNCKWSLLGAPYQSDAFLLQDQCLSILEGLRPLWNGRDFTPPDRSAAAQAFERRLEHQCWFKLHSAENSATTITLLPGHQFGAGRSMILSNWCVRDGSDGYEITFYNTAYPSFVFPAVGDGPWIGRATSGQQLEALLAPTSTSENSVDVVDSERGLVDDFIDVAMRGAPTIPINADHLLGALVLLARMDAGVSKQVTARADEMELTHPEMADTLRRIAAQLPPPMLDMDARPRKWASLSDPELYLRR